MGLLGMRLWHRCFDGAAVGAAMTLQDLYNHAPRLGADTLTHALWARRVLRRWLREGCGPSNTAALYRLWTARARGCLCD